jgi:hypothetical protein
MRSEKVYSWDGETKIETLHALEQLEAARAQSNRIGEAARFETDEEAERVLLAAGFKFVPDANSSIGWFRA